MIFSQCRGTQCRKDRNEGNKKLLKRDEDQRSKLSRRQQRQQIGRELRVRVEERVWRIAGALPSAGGLGPSRSHLRLTHWGPLPH